MTILRQTIPHASRRFRFIAGAGSIVVLSLVLFATSTQADVFLEFSGGDVPAGGEAQDFVLNLVQNTDEDAIHAFDLSLSFDVDVVDILAVRAATGTGAWGDPAWSTGHGVLRIAHAGAVPVINPSQLYTITMAAAVNPAGESTEFEFTTIELNDGSPAATGLGATVFVTGTPIHVDGVTISPVTLNVREGETASFEALVATNGDPAVEWSFGEGFTVGQILSTGVYVAPTELATSRVVVIRAASRIFPAAYAEAAITVLPVVGEPQAELWITANPANRRFVEIYASVGTNPDAAVLIQVGEETLVTTMIGSPVFAHRASYHADADVESIVITAEIDNVSISRPIQF